MAWSVVCSAERGLLPEFRLNGLKFLSIVTPPTMYLALITIKVLILILGLGLGLVLVLILVLSLSL